MADYLDRGLPFRVDDLWRPPSTQNTYDEASVFEAITTDLPPLALPKEFQTLDLDLGIPQLDVAPDQWPAPGSEEAEQTSEVPDPPELDHEGGPFLDIWDLEKDLNEQNERPKLCTWEAFERKIVPDSERVALLSESGPAAFDAVVSSLEPRNDIGVLPQDYTLRALCNLALGRSSSLFQWNSSKAEFEQTLEGASISGLSRICGESTTKDIISVGNLMSKLRKFAGQSFALRACPAFVALQSAASCVLDAVEESISKHLRSVRSIIQLNGLIGRSRRLLLVLDSLVTTAKHARSNQAVISASFDVVSLHSQTAHELDSTLHHLLGKVSAPWFQSLAHDMGFRRPDDALLGPSESDDQDQTKWDKISTFAEPEDCELIRETASAARLLRETSPDHYLLADGDGAMFTAFTDPALTRASAFAISKSYEKSLMSRRSQPNTSELDQCRAVVTNPTSADVWKDEASMQSYLDGLDALMSESSPPGPSGGQDDLHMRARDFCSLTGDQPHDDASFSTEGSVAPLERVRPLLQTQHRLMNGVLLRQLFRDHSLKHHLQLQYSFQLLENGYFVDRLSTALFRSDVQTAERRRDQKVTAETMGLRLGASHEERWPPASSELQLALTGILNEAYARSHSADARYRAHSETLPGSLSFAIRELPEAEIDRVLDPNSIYALDFLRLQYTPTPPLDAILTHDALKAYDEIFRFLLRLLRVIHVTTNLPRKQTGQREDSLDEASLSFAVKAQSFVSVLLSHVMDIGIAAPWQDLIKTVTNLETALQAEDAEEAIGTKAPMGIEGLRQLHSSCLDQMRSRLFLKRRQQKLRDGLEGVLVAILNASFALQSGDDAGLPSFQNSYAEFRKAVAALLRAIEEQANKPPKSIAAADTEDAETLRLLLTRLDWNGFYSNG